MEQLDGTLGPGNQGIARRIIQTRLDNGVLADGDKYWLTDEVIAEGVTNIQTEIQRLQAYLDYLQAQRSALAKRGL